MEPTSSQEWALRDGSAGCACRTLLNCTGDGFMRLHGVKLPDRTNAMAKILRNIQRLIRLYL
jgi:hypothetical protein